MGLDFSLRSLGLLWNFNKINFDSLVNSFQDIDIIGDFAPLVHTGCSAASHEFLLLWTILTVGCEVLSMGVLDLDLSSG